MNSLDICNMALAQLKCRSILDINGGSEEAVQCRRYYDYVRRLVLRAHNWKFAQRVAPLALLSDVRVDRWCFSYIQPGDCLYIHAVFPDGFLRVFEKKANYFECYSISEAVTAICCDVEGAYIKYTYDLLDVGRFPDDFINVLVYALSYKLALPLTSSDKLHQLNFSLYREALSEATIANFNEADEALRYKSSIVKARF